MLTKCCYFELGTGCIAIGVFDLIVGLFNIYGTYNNIKIGDDLLIQIFHIIVSVVTLIAAVLLLIGIVKVIYKL